MVAVLLFAIDRLSKYFVQNLPLGKVFSFWPGFEFGYYHNPAIIFSLKWSGVEWLALFAFIVVGILLIKSLIFHGQASVLFVFLGGASNVFDRFKFGGVIDVLQVGNYLVLNLADVLITIGIVLMLIDFKYKHQVKT